MYMVHATMLLSSPVFLFCVIHICAYKVNLPISSDAICEDLNPHHIFPNITKEHSLEICPFTVECNSSLVEIGYPVIITVKSQDESSFRGFILQVRYLGLPCGKFEPQPNLQVLECKGKGPVTKHYDISNMTSNIAIYYDNKPKTSFELIWYAPNYFLGDVNMYMTILVDMNTFWVASKIKNITSVMYDYRYHPELYTTKITTVIPTNPYIKLGRMLNIPFD